MARWLVTVSLGLFVGATALSSSVRRVLENAYIGWPLAEVSNRYRPRAYRARSVGCPNALVRSGLPFAVLPENPSPSRCPAVLPVVIHWPLIERRYMNCRLALSLHAYWEESLRPLARSILDEDVERIGDLGVRSCRPMTGHRFLLSEHAFSNAIDVASFRLRGGAVIEVERDWNSDGVEGEFLRRAAHAACAHFRMVISPDHDASHPDHFHLDMGLDKGCYVDEEPE